MWGGSSSRDPSDWNEGGNKEPTQQIAGSTYLLVVVMRDTAARFFGDGLDIERRVSVG